MLFHAIAAGMTTARPRMCAAVPMPITRPDASIDRTAGESVVKRRGHADDLLEFTPAPGPQRSADDGDDARARGQRIAP